MGMTVLRTVMGEEVEVEITVVGRVSAYDPGEYTARPEDCYPAEGGVVEEIEATDNENGEPFGLTQAEVEEAETEIGRLAERDHYDSAEVARAEEEAYDRAYGRYDYDPRYDA